MPLYLFIDIFECVHLIKIDVKGNEKNVLLSMKNLILRDRPVLFVEIYQGENSNTDPTGTISMVWEWGYKAYVLRGNKLEPFISHEDNYYNYYFIPTENVK